MISINCFFISFSQVRVAVRGGYNHSSAKVKYSAVDQPTGYKPGFNVGIQAKVPFEPPLYFSPFISYSLRGYTISPLSGTIQKSETSIHYIDVAPLLSYVIKTGNQNHFTISAGPLAGLAFSGKEKITEAGVTTSSNIKFNLSGSYGYYDLAIYSSVGYHFNRVFIEAAYQHGITSINNEEEFDGRNIQHRLFSVNVGYYIK